MPIDFNHVRRHASEPKEESMTRKEYFKDWGAPGEWRRTEDDIAAMAKARKATDRILAKIQDNTLASEAEENAEAGSIGRPSAGEMMDD